jgi:hypothetical protein
MHYYGTFPVISKSGVLSIIIIIPEIQFQLPVFHSVSFSRVADGKSQQNDE